METAQDCFHFVTKFFEPINISATHIYHSALELCPISSIVRKLYYNRCHGITRLPRVMIGTQDSWDPTISFSGKHYYKSSTWSPCGRFVASTTERSVEIRNQFTFELLAVLQSNQKIHSENPLAYSPDGRSLACGWPDAIVIWDIQTGGVAQEIKCSDGTLSLTWSLDGRNIAVIADDRFAWRMETYVRTYEVASGALLFSKKSLWGVPHHLWACGKSFRLLTANRDCSDLNNIIYNITISEIGPTLTKIESFSVKMGPMGLFHYEIAFSPSTYHISILDRPELRVFDMRNSDCLLVRKCDSGSPRFSSNGSFFGVPDGPRIRIWKYTSGSHILWGIRVPKRTSYIL